MVRSEIRVRPVRTANDSLQPAFQAINLEPEENVDEQIDTTKELHVDEALKRFQTALKLHAQGPRAREAAAAAYKELFASEIFDYREAKTDYERTERQADGRPEVSAVESFLAGLDIDAGGADGVAANLSQALYLSYKNFGQFNLDKLKDESKSDPEWKAKARLRYQDEAASKVIDNWTAALDQDPSDPELWRRAARFAASMNSGRVKRYCLEAAVELDDDPAIMEVEPPSLAEGLAGQQLKDYLHVLDDNMSLSHPVMAPWLNKEMPALIKRHLDPIPFLPDPSATLTPPPSSPEPPKSLPDTVGDDAESADGEASEAITSWTDFGLELMKCLQDTDGALRACRQVLKAAQEDAEMADDDQSKKPSGVTTTPAAGDRSGGTDAKDKPKQLERQTSNITDEGSKVSEPSQKERETSMSTRKRSQSTAGLPEAAEENGAEKRSKRVRRRTETKDLEEATDPSTLIANQIQSYQEVDLHLFEMTKNILESLGVEDKDTFDCLQELLDSCTVEDRPSKVARRGALDLRSIMTGFNEETAMVLLNKKEQATLGLSSFLDHAKSGSQEKPQVSAFNESQGLRKFAEKMSKHQGWMTSDDIAFEWVQSMSQSYTDSKWSDSMKVAVVQMLNRVDAVVYERIMGQFEMFADAPDKLTDLETLVPMLFELHLDIYERITNPNSAVDYATRMETKYRLDRWLDVASTYVRLLDRPDTDPLCVRFLWASVLSSSLADSPVREHILLLWTSLRDFLTTENIAPINLPNNVVMPTISAAAADREISKLTTMDFFLGLFQEEMEDPVHVIETLEPVLNPSSVYISAGSPRSSAGPDEPSEEDKAVDGQPISECANQGLRDLWKFLLNSSTELRLFLWSRLGDAYAKIKYPTKRFSCLLKSIEMIVADLEGDMYAQTPDESRRLLFMRTLKSLDELLIQALSTALNDGSAFDIIDEGHIRSSSCAIAKISCMLHVAPLCEDEARIGITNAPSNNSTFMSLVNKLREMQVRAWSLQYTMFKAALPQQESAISPENDLAEFLAAVHRAIGLRKFCKASNKIFLKMMRLELLKFKIIENWEHHLGQVLYDLHGLKLGVGVWEVQDHGCPYDKLEKRQSMQLVEKIMILANRMPMKDLLKSDLKTTIEHMQQTIGQPKSTPQMYHNLRNFTEILKKPIHPLRLYQALSGGVSVDSVTANVPEAALAKFGWFFLLGMIALTKFKGVDLNRRQTPGATDDLRIGATFLRLQLQFTADNWEAWFRLAECFDYELDESVLWSADKMNKDRAELVKFQRNAIHCYTLALSHSRHLDIAVNDIDPLHDLYHKFAMRMYSSSREPFGMEPFKHSDQERFFIETMGAGTFKKILHDEMSEYKVWKFAAKLFRMAIARRPANWKNPYMLAKCYWKMFQTPEEKLDATDQKTRITTQLVVDTLKKSIEVATNAQKSRRSDPILEPHYKIASVLHKMVTRGEMPAKEAAAILSEQPFGVPLNPEDHYAAFSEPEDWEEYIIRNLTKLRDKDKSNWHHRIVMRHARILFEESRSTDDGEGLVEAKAAFAILKENMFTKTMVMNVWKCDAERPGRHYVFTEQYVRFMTKLLLIMDDRTNLELLLRRLRKKGADFYHFTDLWATCCMAYIKLLRAAYKVQPALDDAYKSLSTEEFEIISERITEWAAGDGPHIEEFSCMKEAVELKKLNVNLMKATPIDDLINDCYTKIYLDIAPTLPGVEPSKIIAERNHAKEVAAQLEAVAQADAKQPKSLSSLLNPTNGQDSAAGSATPLDADKSESAPRARKGVRRPDILRKAEQAVVRAMEVPKPVTAKSRVGSISSKRGSQTPAVALSDAGSDAGSDDEDEGPDAQVRREAAENLDEEMQDADGHDEGEDDVDGHDDSRADKEHDTEVGSIHDSADDESDLSDVPEGYDEEVPPGLLFPNLSRAEASGETSGEEADSESEGEDEAEEAEAEEHMGTEEEHEELEGEEHELEHDEEEGTEAEQLAHDDEPEEHEEEHEEEVEEDVEEEEEVEEEAEDEHDGEEEGEEDDEDEDEDEDEEGEGEADEEDDGGEDGNEDTEMDDADAQPGSEHDASHA
ncbi:transcriptional corepressor for histone Hir3 [Purpureocillium lavendulum]|uniref:Histone transcription regulator 3 homolog n=1 Tax=Purpureocillium lavendulum TaxID=1247861 RepID=A0AB34G487_9HYPO|nr:transcriptional corepressor for histone Hir3 [Purpureocillium lavendulum]